MTYEVSTIRIEKFNNGYAVYNPNETVVTISSKYRPVYERLTLGELATDFNHLKSLYRVTDREIMYLRDKARILIANPQYDMVDIDLDAQQVYWQKTHMFMGHYCL